VSGLAREAERAQLMALRAHLDPHFLFNTLNAIAEWCREDGETAERAVLQLSAMLRTVLAGVQAATWPLADELALMDTLFALHRLRDPDAFQLVRRVPAPLPDVPVPPMLLLPLAENAVKHGPTAGHRGPIELEVQVSVDDARLIFSLSNPGRYAGRREGGTGLETVDGQAMVKIAGLDATPTEMERTVVEVTLPLAGPRT
jgi:LytS/YehU family sensor histidine kinase